MDIPSLAHATALVDGFSASTSVRSPTDMIGYDLPGRRQLHVEYIYDCSLGAPIVDDVLFQFDLG